MSNQNQRINNPKIAEVLAYWLGADDMIQSIYEDDNLALVVTARNRYDGTAYVDVLRLFTIGDKWELSRDKHISISGNIDDLPEPEWLGE